MEWVFSEGPVKAWMGEVLRGHEELLTCGPEDSGITEAVASSEGLHHPVNLLGFARQPEAPQELPRGTGPWSVTQVGSWWHREEGGE